ncbi:PTS transporter subunit IIC, partial [Clostridioides difficile]|uniref:PTS transporter subunit IIC n=1 Tax=Clostridioides difficile TaxID=1496 RepID=UPI002E8E45DE
MLINQIMPAFQGISEKVVPNALPAFDLSLIHLSQPPKLSLDSLSRFFLEKKKSHTHEERSREVSTYNSIHR